MEKCDFSLQQHGDGRLTLCRPGQAAVAVMVKRCFPWSEPLSWLSLRDEEGREVELIADPTLLEESSRLALLSSLEEAAFVFRIEQIVSITEEFELRIWRVRLREGERVFQTRLLSWPRELPGGGLLIQDVGNDLYLVANPDDLDSASRNFLWAFMDD